MPHESRVASCSRLLAHYTSINRNKKINRAFLGLSDCPTRTANKENADSSTFIDFISFHLSFSHSIRYKFIFLLPLLLVLLKVLDIRFFPKLAQVGVLLLSRSYQLRFSVWIICVVFFFCLNFPCSFAVLELSV